MDITVVNGNGREDVAVLRLKGDFDASGERNFDAAAGQAHRNGARFFIIDFSDVPFMSSAGIRALNGLYKTLSTDLSEQEQQAARKGIRTGGYAAPNLKLVNPNEKVEEVLKMTGLEMFLGIYKDEKKALAAI